MQQYIDGLEYILKNGVLKKNRTGIDTLSVFGYQSRYDLQKGFPAITTKKLFVPSIISELLWFLEGSSDERRLSEILYGTRDPSKKTIWTDNANASYWKSKAKFEGDCGRIYGIQMRTWMKPDGTSLDQVQNLIEGLQKDPTGRRHIIVNYNPAEINEMALPPCHAMVQFDVTDNKLSCQLYQRSCDYPIGAPYNIFSYALFTHMIAHVCGFEVGTFIHTIGDMHIYEDQLDAIDVQFSRTPHILPTLWLNPNIKNIFDFKMNDIKLINYKHHPSIKMKMSV